MDATTDLPADADIAAVATLIERIDGDARHGLVLIADHAGRSIPGADPTLGLPPTELERHIAWDIGAAAVTRALAALLGAPAVMATFSRLWIDANRGEDDPTLIRRIYDRTIIPGNLTVDATERLRRLNTCHRPYQRAVRAMIDDAQTLSGAPPLVVSIHSFTPQLAGGALRPWHIGILSDADRRAADRLIASLGLEPDIVTGDNEPYDGALKGDTLYEQASRRGYAHVLIEIRQDLIGDDAGARAWAARLAPHITALNANPSMHEARLHGSRAGGLPVA
jgi:predicted N-formylglutamate amidohydrolase